MDVPKNLPKIPPLQVSVSDEVGSEFRATQIFDLYVENVAPAAH